MSAHLPNMTETSNNHTLYSIIMKTAIKLLLLIAICCMTTVQADAQTKKQSLTPVYMGLWGDVGGTTFLFDMNGTTGSYIPYDKGNGREYGERRQLKLVSYNPKTGKCVIKAYLKKAYIGQFNGIFQEDTVDMGDGETKTMQSYTGTFTGVKGSKLHFYLYFD